MTAPDRSSWEMYQAPQVTATNLTAEHVEPQKAKCIPTIVLLGEAPGAEEEKTGQPFVGASGQLLRKTLLPAANLSADQCHILNTFIKRPPNNDLKHWTANKTELKRLGLTPSGEPLNKRYLLPEHRWQLEELDLRLRAVNPDLIICLGSTALWAISGHSQIGTYRGSFFDSPYGKAIATFHPAALLRQWSNLPLAWADLKKASSYLAGTLVAPLRRRIWINPTFAEMANVYARFRRNPTAPLGVDIETSPAIAQITTISFGTATESICIPLWDKDGLPSNPHVYPTAAEELKAWRWIERFAALPNPKVMQNGLYDSQYLMDSPLDIRLTNWQDDTALLSHSLQPELPKALGTLASLYLNEPSWKQMRTSTKDAKADE